VSILIHYGNGTFLNSCCHLITIFLEKEKQWLEECRKSIELLLGWGNSSLWNNDDFERLSAMIWEKPWIRLSVSTLKRIDGKVRYRNSPNNFILFKA
jgi:hypothetical protein